MSSKVTPFFFLVTLFVSHTCSFSASSVGNQGLKTYDCGSVYHVNNLTFNDCQETTSERCNFYVGRTITNSIGFNIALENVEASRITQDVYLNIRGFRFNVDVTPSDPCAILPCSTLNDQFNKTVEYRATITTYDIPAIEGDLYWVFYNGDTLENVLCFYLLVSAVQV